MSKELAERNRRHIQARLDAQSRAWTLKGKLRIYHDGRRRVVEYFAPLLAPKVRALPFSESFDGALTMTREAPGATIAEGDTGSLFRSAAHAVFLVGVVPLGACSVPAGAGCELTYDHGDIGVEHSKLLGGTSRPVGGTCQIERRGGTKWLSYKFAARGSLAAAIRERKPYEVTIETRQPDGKLSRVERLAFVRAEPGRFRPVLGLQEAGIPVSDGRLIRLGAPSVYEWTGVLLPTDQAVLLARRASEAQEGLQTRDWAVPTAIAGATVLGFVLWRSRRYGKPSGLG